MWQISVSNASQDCNCWWALMQVLGRDKKALHVSNVGEGAAVWMLRSHGSTAQDGSLLSLPNWLSVSPAGGMLLPQVQHSMF